MTPRSKKAHALGLALLIPLVLLEAKSASAEEPSTKREGRESVAVTASLLTPFFSAYEMEAKIRASNSVGLVVNTSYLTYENHDWKTKTGTVGAGVNYFFQHDALRRWYVEAIGELMFSSWRHEPSKQVAPVALGYTGLAFVGYMFVWSRGPVLDLGAGVVAFHLPSAHITSSAGSLSSEAFTKLYPSVKINVGWAF